MKKNQIFSYVVMGCALIAIIGLFVPYVSFFGTSMSLWKSKDSSRVLLIIYSLVPVVVYLFNKKTGLSYLTSGGLLLHSLSTAIANEGLDNLSIGFYLITLSAIAIGVLTFLYDEKQGRAIINLNTNKPVYNQQPVQPVQPVQQPVQQPSFDPQTGEPLNNNQNN